MKTQINTLFVLFVVSALSCSVKPPPTLECDFMESSGRAMMECAADSLPALLEKVRLDEKDAEAWRRLSVCYRAMGTPEYRLESARAIDRALELAPDNPVYHVERGLTMYSRQFIGSARRSLERALELDPGCFDAWYNLGRIQKDLYLRKMASERDLKDALSYYRRAYNISGRHRETLFHLSLLNYIAGRQDLCAKYARRGAGYFPESYLFRLLLGCEALEGLRFGDAAAHFDSALALMDGRTRYFYEDIAILLPEEERIRYDNLDDTIREDTNRRFWVRNDPTPATPINERRLEHYRRCFLAEALLTNERLGLEGRRTARGRTLISYGLPDAILIDPGSGLDGPFLTWSYLRGGRLFQLFFQDEFLSGDYHIPIDSRFSDYAMITEGILQNIDQMYVFPVDHRQIPLAVECVQFRGPGEDTRLLFALALPDSFLDGRIAEMELDFTLFDSDWRLFRSESVDIDPDSLLMISKPSGRWALFELEMLVPQLSLESRFAFEVRCGETAGRGLFRGELTVSDMSGRNLSMSGLRLSPAVSGVCTSRLDPLPSYEAGSSLCVYYEIYNLSPGGGISRYRLSYRVLSAEVPGGPSSTLSWIRASAKGSRPKPETHITSSLYQSTDKRSTSDRLLLDIGSLEPGRYLLIIDVEDLATGFRVSSERRFSVVPRRISR